MEKYIPINQFFGRSGENPRPNLKSNIRLFFPLIVIIFCLALTPGVFAAMKCDGKICRTHYSSPVPYVVEEPEVDTSSFKVAAESDPKPCASMCHYYQKTTSDDFFPDSDNLEYAQLQTYIGVLNDRENPTAIITNPTLEFWWNPDDLYDKTFDMFDRSQPSYINETAGYANFYTLSDVNSSNMKEGTFAIDQGARYADVGFDVTRQMTNGGLVSSSGTYTIDVSVTVHNATGGIGIGIDMPRNDWVKGKVTDWSASPAPDDNDSDTNGVNIDYHNPAEATYTLSVTYYVNKSRAGDIRYKPHVWVERRTDLQGGETTGNTTIDIIGKFFNMNASFSSDGPHDWRYDEQFARNIQLQELIKLEGPHAMLKVEKDSGVSTTNDSISSGIYTRSPHYQVMISNGKDTSGTTLGDLKVDIQARNITHMNDDFFSSRNGNRWNFTFPSSLRLDEKEEYRIHSDRYSPEFVDLGVSLSRQMNHTVFSSDGHQLLNGTITFENLDFKWTGIQLETGKYNALNATIVPGTLETDAPVRCDCGCGSVTCRCDDWRNEGEHWVHMDLDKDYIKVNVTYNFSVVINVELTNNEGFTMVYKPRVNVYKGNNRTSASSTSSYTAVVPQSILPEGFDYVSATTNTSNSWVILIENYTVAMLKGVAMRNKSGSDTDGDGIKDWLDPFPNVEENCSVTPNWKIGDYYNYTNFGPLGPMPMTIIINDTVIEDGQDFYKVQMKFLGLTNWMLATQCGLNDYRMWGEFGDNLNSPSFDSENFPLYVGKSWEWNETANARLNFTVTGEETVKTPAGTFESFIGDGRIYVPWLEPDTLVWHEKSWVTSEGLRVKNKRLNYWGGVLESHVLTHYANIYDEDLDGFNATDYGGDDCKDYNPNINPNATEMPNNGVDEDCDGKDAVAKFSLSIDSVQEVVAKNQNAIYLINITNTGDVNDSYIVKLHNPDYAKIGLNTSFLELENGTSGHVSMNVTSGRPGNYTVYIKVSSTKYPVSRYNATKTIVLGSGLGVMADAYEQTVGTNKTATFTLFIKNKGNAKDNYSVSASSTANVYSVPENITLEGGAAGSVQLKANASVSGTYIIEANITSDAGLSKSLNLTLNVEDGDVHALSLTSDRIFASAELGKNASYNITIKNIGNKAENVSFILENPSGADTGFDTTPIYLLTGESSTRILNVSNSTRGRYKVSVIAYSANARTSLLTTTRIASTFSLRIDPVVQVAYQNTTASYIIYIVNTGTKQHAYTISVVNNTDFANLSKSSVSLSKKETAEISLKLKNSEGGRYNATITVTTVDTGETKNHKAKLMVVTKPIYGVAVTADSMMQSIQPGTNAEYILSVVNLGNVNDTYNITLEEIDDADTATFYNATGGVFTTTLLEVPPGYAKPIYLKVGDADYGIYAVRVTAASITRDFIKDSLVLKTVVAGLEDYYIDYTSFADEDSVLKDDSNVTDRSIIVDSIISASNVDGSIIIDSEVSNSSVSNTTLIDVVLNNTQVRDGKITSGTIIKDGVEFEIESETSIDELVDGADEEDSSISGLEDDMVEVDAENANVKFAIFTEDSFVGGSMKVVKARDPPKSARGMEQSKRGIHYYEIDVSDNINASMNYTTITVEYDPDRLPSDVKESSLKLRYYNGTDWVDVEDQSLNESGNYVKANVTHFSVYGIAGAVYGMQGGIEGGGGGGPSLPKITVTTENGSAKIKINFLPANTDTTVSIPDTGDVPLTSLKINVNKKVTNIEMTVTKLDERPSNISRDITGKVLDYIQIETNINDEDINNVTNGCRVPKSWINTENIDTESIVMYRYTDGKWNALDTIKALETSQYLIYSALSPGFSYFGLSGETVKAQKLISLPVTLAPKKIAPTTPPPPTVPLKVAQSKDKFLGICGPTAILLIAMLIPWFYFKRR